MNQFHTPDRVIRAELVDDGWLVLRRVKPLHGLPRYVIMLDYGDGETQLLHDCEGASKADRLWWKQREALTSLD